MTHSPAISLESISQTTGAPLAALRVLCRGHEKANPMAYQTVWSFLAKHESGAMSLMQEPVEGLADENRRAKALADAMGVMAVSRGVIWPIGEVWAVPPMVLERMFPV